MNINAGGADRVAEIAHALAERGRLRRFVHVSTAYVAGRHAGRFHEHEHAAGQAFRNTYEHSKFHAEALLRDQYDLPLVTVRPSIIIGDSRSGWTPTFNVIYWPLRAFAAGRLDAVAADPAGRLDVVPVDYVADGIIAAHDDDRASGTIALVAGEQAVTIAELAELAGEHFGRPVPKLGQADAGTFEHGEVYLPYFDVRGTLRRPARRASCSVSACRRRRRCPGTSRRSSTTRASPSGGGRRSRARARRDARVELAPAA